MAITNAQYAAWVSRLNAIRVKHGMGNSSLSAPGVGTKATASKMNSLLNTGVGSNWIRSTTMGITNVSAGTRIFNSLSTAISNTLTSWESVCVHNTVFNSFFDSDFSDDEFNGSDDVVCYDNFAGEGENISNFR